MLWAAQLRAGENGAKLCAALLERRADLDAVTRRGHTALLFAAGRGHAATVHLLLDSETNAIPMTIINAIALP